MHAFVDWAVIFAQSHVLLAYGLAFVLAATEAFPVIGAAVPGPTVIVAFGTLILAGALFLWLFFGSVTLGAIFGMVLPIALACVLREHRPERTSMPTS